MFRHIIRLDHKTVCTSRETHNVGSDRKLVWCTLDDTSITEVEPSKRKDKRRSRTRKELERSAIRVNEMGGKSKHKIKSERNANRKNVAMRSGGKSR